MNWELWGPPLAVLGIGLVAGLVIIFRSRSDQTAVAEVDTRIKDLQARKASILEQIRALDVDLESNPSDALKARREALVDQAAQVLRDLETETRAAPDAASASPGSESGAGRRAVWGIVAVAFFVVLGVGLVQFSTPKEQGGMGGGMGGGMSAGPASGAATMELPPALQEYATRLESNPDDLEALNELTYYAMLMRDMDSAMAYLDRARKLSPEDADVLVHLAMLQASVGMFDRALPTIEQAVAAAPDRGKPLLWKGFTIVQMGNGPKAREAVEAAVAKGLSADEVQLAQAILAEAETLPDAPLDQVTSRVPAGGAEAHPTMSAPPPGMGGAQASDAAPTGDARLSGTLSVSGDGAAPTAGVLFVIARTSPTPAGPPLAALRLSTHPFPSTFTFTDASVMMGGPWPEQVWIQAKVDADGTPDTKSDEDLASPVLGPFTAGTTGVEVVLGAGG